MARLHRFGTVIFDCDSTLSAIEGIEELAGERRAEVVALTEAAMAGAVPLEDVYGRRLELVRPDRAGVERLGRRYIETLVPDAREVVSAIRAAGITVRIMSGGLRPAVLALARELGLEDDTVAAVDVSFDRDGGYADFDRTAPLTRAGGKLELLERWAPELACPLMLVGDGATDLEALPRIDVFVAFAGVVERPAVAAAAHVVIRSASLAPILPLALGGEPPLEPVARATYDKGIRLLDYEYRILLDEPTDPER